MCSFLTGAIKFSTRYEQRGSTQRSKSNLHVLYRRNVASGRLVLIVYYRLPLGLLRSCSPGSLVAALHALYTTANSKLSSLRQRPDRGKKRSTVHLHLIADSSMRSWSHLVERYKYSNPLVSSSYSTSNQSRSSSSPQSPLPSASLARRRSPKDSQFDPNSLLLPPPPISTDTAPQPTPSQTLPASPPSCSTRPASPRSRTGNSPASTTAPRPATTRASSASRATTASSASI